MKTRENSPNLLIAFARTSSAGEVTPQLLGQLPVSAFLTSYYLEAESEGESAAGRLRRHRSPQRSPPGGDARPALSASPSGSPTRVAFLRSHAGPGEARELFPERGRGSRARQSARPALHG